MRKNRINLCLIGVNIIFLLYYALQLLIFTDEFALKNIGFFNHAVAGLSEIIGIIFFSLAVGLSFMLIKGLKNQLPLLITILLMQIFIALNFWRYVLTNSPGETSINAITFNALIFSLSGFSMFLLLLRQKND
ncbi:MAG: hypothetical protein CFH12_00896 [Alphaproteobacteria bacterium MarineAlpha5_Bin2]|nr:MAG: hypothetical protein CFH12_00896 [Alphaproteobacteria bacterium MarineAlpha5_Bin2]